MVFVRLFQSENRVSVATCKVKSAFSLKGYLIRSTGLYLIKSDISSEYFIDQNIFLPGHSYTFP